MSKPTGPPPEFRFEVSQIVSEMQTAGYRPDAQHDFLPRQHFLAAPPDKNRSASCDVETAQTARRTATPIVVPSRVSMATTPAYVCFSASPIGLSSTAHPTGADSEAQVS